MSQEIRPAVILSTDCGVEMDDQWALVHLALSPEIDLLGVVGAQAPVLVSIDADGNMGPQVPAPDSIAEFTAEAARATIRAMPVAPVPVFAGSHVPLSDPMTAQPSAGADYIIETAGSFSSKNRLRVLTIGPATDVASAILLDPSIVDRISVIAMAFNTWPAGTDLFNVKNDIIAWQVLMASRTSVTIGDWAVCKMHLKRNREEASAMFSDLGRPGAYLVNLLSSWLDHQSDKAQILVDDEASWSVWDEVTVAHVLGLTETRTYPRPVLRDDMSFSETDGSNGTIDWIVAVDDRRLWDDFRQKLRHALECGKSETDG